jgi:hypothetical protein
LRIENLESLIGGCDGRHVAAWVVAPRVPRVAGNSRSPIFNSHFSISRRDWVGKGARSPAPSGGAGPIAALAGDRPIARCRLHCDGKNDVDRKSLGHPVFPCAWVAPAAEGSISPNAAAATEGADWLSSFLFLAERTRNENDWRRPKIVAKMIEVDQYWHTLPRLRFSSARVAGVRFARRSSGNPSWRQWRAGANTGSGRAMFARGSIPGRSDRRSP